MATPTRAFNEFLYEFLRIFFNFGKFVKIREFFFCWGNEFSIYDCDKSQHKIVSKTEGQVKVRATRNLFTERLVGAGFNTAVVKPIRNDWLGKRID